MVNRVLNLIDYTKWYCVCVLSSVIMYVIVKAR